MANNWSKIQPDVIHDLSEPLPYEDEVADEIHAYHVVEHFQRYVIEDILYDWVRVLKPGGKLVIEVPCLDSVIAIFNMFIEKQKPLPQRYTLWALYGDPGYRNEAMIHKWCYSRSELQLIMESLGLKVSFHKPQTHIAARDMRAEGIKCTKS